MKRAVMSVTIGLLVAAVVSAAGHREVSDEPTPGFREELTVLGLRGPTGVVLASALVDSPIETENAVVTTGIVGSPDVMVSRLVSGQADIGMLPTNVVAQLYNRDVPVQIAAITLWGVLYVVTTDPAIEEWRDLKDRTVYSLSPGSTPDVLFRHLLDRNGIDPEEDLSVDYRYGHVELAQAVVAGLVDTAVLPEPFVTSVIQRRSDARVALDFQAESRRLYGSSYPQTAIVVRGDVARQAPEAVNEALSVIRSSLDEALSDPEETAILAQQTGIGIPAPAIVRALPRLNAEYVSSGDARDQVMAYLDLLYRFEPGTIGGALPDDGLFY